MKKLIRKVRRKRSVMRMSTRDRKISEYHGEKLREESWERDKHVVRMANFDKALLGLKQYREEIQAEKDRQAAIREARLKNLAKARKVAKKRRSAK